MPIYRVTELRSSRLRLQQWRRRILHTIGLLFGTIVVCAIGMIALDSTGQPLPAKMFRGDGTHSTWSRLWVTLPSWAGVSRSS
jgi:hypothetical protein